MATTRQAQGQTIPINNGHWHLDKRVSVGHIVSTLLVVATFALWLMSLDGRVTGLEREMDDIHQHVADNRAINKEQFDKLENRMSLQNARLESRMEAQYAEIIRRLEILDARLSEHQKSTIGK